MGGDNVNKFDSSSPKDTLSQDWLKLTKWFWSILWKCEYQIYINKPQAKTTNKFDHKFKALSSVAVKRNRHLLDHELQLTLNFRYPLVTTQFVIGLLFTEKLGNLVDVWIQKFFRGGAFGSTNAVCTFVLYPIVRLSKNILSLNFIFFYLHVSVHN